MPDRRLPAISAGQQHVPHSGTPHDALRVADVGDRVRQAAETVYQAMIEAELTGSSARELFADRGYDFDKYRRAVRERGITPGSPAAAPRTAPGWARSAGSSQFQLALRVGPVGHD